MISQMMAQFNKITDEDEDEASRSHNAHQFSIHDAGNSHSYGGFEDEEEESQEVRRQQSRGKEKEEEKLPSQKKNKFQEERDRIDREMEERARQRELAKKSQPAAVQRQSTKKGEQPEQEEKKKVDPFKYYMQKMGKGGNEEESSSVEVSGSQQQFSLKQSESKANKSGKFEVASSKDYDQFDQNDFEYYEASQESAKKFEVRDERQQERNVFRSQAMVNTTKKMEGKVDESAKEIQISMKSGIKQQSEVAFDDEIEDHFSEEPIDDDELPGQVDFQENSAYEGEQSAPDNGTLMMGSVVPHPKIVQNYSLGSTVLKQETTLKKQGTQPQPIDEIDEDWGQEEEKKEDEEIQFEQNSFDEPSVHAEIAKIEPKWSPKGSPEVKATLDEEAKTKGKSKEKRSKSKKAQGSMRPQTAKVIKQTKNTDLKDVMQTSQSPQRDNQSKPRHPTAKAKNEQSKTRKEETKEEQKKPPLLSQKQKSSRLIVGGQRPESAKPKAKVGFEGKGTALAGKKAQNTNDLTALLAQNKKFQMIKQLKEEKEKKKEVIVRDLKKAKVIPSSKKAPKLEEKKGGMNEDLMFEEEVVGAGDQGSAPPADLNAQFEKEMDAEFKLKQQKKGEKVNKEQKREEGFVGNALGSGAYQKQHEEIKRENVNMGLQPSRKQLKPLEADVKRESSFQNQPQASKPKNLQRIEDERKERELEEKARKEAESKAKFQQLMKEKKEKAVNKDVVAFMMQKQEMDKANKKQEFEGHVNKQVANFEVKKEAATGEKKQDKVPVEAKLVWDKEGESKEVADLKRKLKEVNFENRKIQANILQAESVKRQNESHLDKIIREKDLVTINGRFAIRTNLPKGKSFRIEDIPDYDKLTQEKVNPLEPIVRKIELRGYTLDQVFTLLDDDCNQLLTLQEITSGFNNLEIDLTNDEYKELVKQIDANNDGVLTLQEFLATLQPRYEAQKEVREAMAGLNFEDPIDLEERILDLRFRSRRMTEELKVLKRTAGPQSRYVKNPLEGQLGAKIKELESKLSQKMANAFKSKLEYDVKIQSSLNIQDRVQMEYNQAKHEKEQQDLVYKKTYNDLSTTIYALEGQLNESSSKLMAYRTKKEDILQLVNRQKMKLAQMQKMEAKLDGQLEQILGRAINGKDPDFLHELDLKLLIDLNSDPDQKYSKYVTHFSAVTIQRLWKGHNCRHNFAIMKFQMKRLARKLAPVVKKKYQSRKIVAVNIISRAFRRYKARKEELKKLQLRNELKKLKEEEEEEFYQNEQKKIKAARVILKNWRNYKNKKRFNFQFVMRTATQKEFGKSDTIYMPVVRKCIICQSNNAMRYCKPCQEAVYCTDCFNEYHFHGHRKMHVWLRIVYSTKEQDLQRVQKQWVDDRNEFSTKAIVADDSVEEIKDEDIVRKQTIMGERKSVQMDDNAFMKSIFDQQQRSGIQLKDIIIREAETRNLNMRRIKLDDLTDIILHSKLLGLSSQDQKRFAQIVESRLGEPGGQNSEVDVLEINGVWKAK